MFHQVTEVFLVFWFFSYKKLGEFQKKTKTHFSFKNS